MTDDQKWTVTVPPLSFEAQSGDDAVEKAKALFAVDVEPEALPTDELAKTLQFYADPESYFALFIMPDRPAGLFADDIGCCIGPHGDHDHRHGRAARKALGDEWGGTEPCEAMLHEMEAPDGAYPKIWPPED